MSKFYYVEDWLPEPPEEPTFYCSKCEVECESVVQGSIGDELVRAVRCLKCQTMGKVRFQESNDGSEWEIGSVD